MKMDGKGMCTLLVLFLFFSLLCIYMYRKEMLQELNKEEGLNNEHGGVEGRSKSCGP